MDSKLYQAAEKRRFQRAISEIDSWPGAGKNISPVLTSPTLAAADGETSSALERNDTNSSRVGQIEISSIGVGAMILEGTEDVTLRRAVGHVRGTALPGQKGNVAIAGHRDTFFRGLRDIHINSEITLTTLKGSYRYRVDSTEVVAPEDTEVLNDSDNATLTLITCYPFNFIGSAPRRFIVRAHRSPR